MFKRSIKIGDQEVDINIFDRAFIEQDDYVFFGHPLGNLKSTDYNNIRGSWLKIRITESKIEIVTDIIGTYRLYYLKDKKGLHISDNYIFLLNKISEIKINKFEYDFWKTHDFTTGGKTFFIGLNKFKPATENIIQNNILVENLYFKNLPLIRDSQKHTEKVFEDLNETFKSIKSLNKKVILMFSGGKDSCLLAFFLMRHKINFKSVFLKLEPTFNQAFIDLQKVKRISSFLNLDTEIISVNLNSFSEEEFTKIQQLQLIDKHFTPIHFKGVEEITRIYGKDILILNGSTSDSIFSFGPSENSKISYIRRHMMFSPRSIISKLGVKMLNFKTKRAFKLGETDDELILALMDEYKYCRVLDKSKSKEYYEYLLHELAFAKNTLTNFNSLEMYAKNYTFLQGTTQQIIHNSCRYNQVKYLMPFASPGIIYSTMQNREIKLEIEQPKYCVDRILRKNFYFDYSKVKTNFEKRKFEYNLDELRAKINNEFEKSLSSLISKS